VLILIVGSSSLGWWGAIVSAEETQTTGRIMGVVRDAKGGRIVGAAVVVRNKDTKRKAQTDTAGMFVLQLPRGVYQVDVRAYLFRPVLIERVQVEENVTKRLEIQLEVEKTRSGPPL
jgi:hypothetical protein